MSTGASRLSPKSSRQSPSFVRWPATVQFAGRGGGHLDWRQRGGTQPAETEGCSCVSAAGADESLIPKWIEEGRGRAEAAVQRPSPAYAAALVATPARGKPAVYTAAFSSSLITSAAVESSSSKIFTCRVVVVRSLWPSRCRTRCRSTPWSISHDACVCRTW
jgi:hypothetical protein